MIVYKSPFALGIYYEENKLFESCWMDDSSQLNVVSAQEEFLKILETIELYKPGFILADTCKFKLEIDETFQNWIVVKFIAAIMELNIKKYAILVTEETYENVSNELMSSFPDENFEIQYFTNRDLALKWLGIK